MIRLCGVRLQDTTVPVTGRQHRRRISMLQTGLETRVNAFLARIEREDINLHGWILTVNGQEKASA